MASEGLVKGKTFWLEKFNNISEFRIADHLITNIGVGDHGTEAYKHSHPIDGEEYSKLIDICKSSNWLLYTSLLAVTKICLSNYSGSSSVVTGSPIPNEHDNDRLIPICSDCSDSDSFKDYLLKLKDILTDAYKYHALPLDALLSESQATKGNLRAEDLFDTVVLLENIHPLGMRSSNKPLIISFNKKENTVEMSLVFQDFALGSLYAERLCKHFDTVLKAVLDDMNRKISELQLLAPEEFEEIMNVFNDTKTEFPQTKTIHQIFEEQVQRTPDNVAVICEGYKLTYQELNAHANQFAWKLRDAGVGAEALVPIIVDRSLEMMIGIMGILKAGGAYLPIDPNFPTDRIQYMLGDCGAALLVTVKKYKQTIEFAGEIICLDERYFDEYDRSDLPAFSKVTDLAYVIYTSGSTGKPKGVMIEHRSVVSRINWMKNMYPITEQDVILQKTPYTFDVSVWELFLYQMVGAKLVMLPPFGEKDPEMIKHAISEHGVTIIHFVPSMLNGFLEHLEHSKDKAALKSLKYLFTSGEALKANNAEKTKQLIGINVANLYGPTEATVDVTYYNCCDTDQTRGIVPIGKPIDNIQMYIIDHNNHLMPVGIKGEICISGNGVARGYLNKPELTAEKFVANPFAKGEKMYRTGDLGRWLPDGNIEYLGRMDDQVKIRGYRIELGEIESVLQQIPEVKEAAVLAKDDGTGDKHLAAYLNYKVNDFSQVKSYLSKMLPDYMIPSRFVRVERMPLTPNGKLDRKALAALDGDVQTHNEYIPPSTETEKGMEVIWEEILGAKRIGVQDSFFDLGGHSLKAITLISAVHKKWNVLIPLKDIFDYPTIQELSQRVEEGSHSAYSFIQQADKADCYPVSSTQKRLLILSQIDRDGKSYHMPCMLSLKGKVNKQQLEHTFQTLVNRHELLRTSFEIRNDEAVQFINEQVDFELKSNNANEEEIEALLERFIQPFDLGKAPLFRAGLVQFTEDHHLLMMDMHHIISDGVSMNIIVKEFMDLYRGDEITPLAVQYKDYAVWQQEQLGSEMMKKQEQYWLQLFEGEIPVAELQTDYPRPEMQSFEGSRLRFMLDARLTQQMNELAERTDSTLYMIMLAAYNIMLSKYTGQHDIVVGSPIAGRSHADVQNMMGLFVNTLAMRNAPVGSKSLLAFLKEVRQNALAAFENQGYPFEELIEKLQVRRNASRNPLFDTMFSLQNMDAVKLELDELEIQSYPYVLKIAKLDLTIEATETEQGIELQFEYNINLFKGETIARMGGHYAKILEAMVGNPEQLLSAIEMVTQEEIKVIEAFNHTQAEYPHNKTIQELFEEQVRQIPDQIAILYEGKQLTYRELNERANQWASYLQSDYHIQAGDLVGIMMERTERMLVVLMGILKAGAAYVPVDPAFPTERIQYILHDSQMKLLITEENYMHILQHSGEQLDHIVFEQAEDKAHLNSTDNSSRINTSADLAYIIYTSGSTGNPKGVMVNHRNVINFFVGMDQQIPCKKDDVFLSVTTISFDISILELFWTLTRGMQVILRASDEYKLNYDRYLPPPKMDLDFSLFFFSSYNYQAEKDKYKLLIESSKYVDKHGFTAVWTPERHFHEFGGLYPNPSVISAALAMITENVQLRSGSIVSPLHPSTRIAEEWSVVDNLSNGRVGLSFASGWHADDFVLQPDAYHNRAKTMYEQIKEVKSLWRGESLYQLNGNGKKIEVRTYPRPLQQELPIWVTTAGNKDSFVQAGSIGANVLTHMLGQDVTKLEENINAYRNALKENGFPADAGKVSLMLHTFIGEDIDEVRAKVKKPFCDYLRSSISLVKNLAEELQLNIDDYNYSEDEVIHSLIEVAFERYWQSSSLMGTPESCMEMVKKLSLAGVDEVACLIDFGIQESEVMDSLQHLVQFKQSLAQAEAGVSALKPVTMMQTTPSRLNILLKDDESQRFVKSLQTILVGGEPLPDELIQHVRKSTSAEIYNMYGPTETTIWSSIRKVQGKSNHNNIGRPIANTQMYILNQELNLMPVGAIGEIYIGGEGVVRGYLHRDELTAERFVEASIANMGPRRIYRTGDLGKLLPDGSIQFAGRNDYQVKIRGYRIELGEIESVLLKHALIREAVVVDYNDESREKHLVAFYVSDHLTDATELRGYLSSRLPHYMVPSLFVPLSSIPLTPNGKVDRVTLKNRPIEVPVSMNHNVEMPRNEQETILADTWKMVLGVQELGIYDDFFMLGGDSIKAIQVSSRLRNHHLELDIRDLFKHPTIAMLSPHIKESKKVIAQHIVEGEAMLTPIQKWFFDQYQFEADQHHYNHSVMLFRKAGFEEGIIEAAFNKIAEHHDALRMLFKQEDIAVQPYNRGLQGQLYDLQTYDYTAEKNAVELLLHAMKKLQGRLSLRQGPLVQLGLFKMTGGDHLLIIVHHLVVDGISWRILLEDFDRGYTQALNGEPLHFSSKTDSFKDWAQYLNKASFANEMDYWRNIAEYRGNPVPEDFKIIEDRMTDSQRMSDSLEAEETELLTKHANKTYGTEINDLLLTALGNALKEWTQQSVIKIDLESHGRLSDQLEISRTVGWFTSLFPVILDVSKPDLSSNIKTIKEMGRSIPNLGIGYGVNKYLSAEDGLSDTVASEILFNYLGQFDQDIQSEVFEVSDIGTSNNISTSMKRVYKLEINGMINKGKLIFSVDFNRAAYKADTIQLFMSNFMKHLKEIINHCTTKQGIELTLSDLTIKDLRKEEAEQFLSDGNIQDIYDLSPMQKGILFHTSHASESAAYFQQFVLDVSGSIEVRLFEESLNLLIERHEVLRTQFLYRKHTRPLQVVMRQRRSPISYQDITHYSEDEQNHWIESLQIKDRKRNFDLENDVLLRISIVQTSEQSYKLIFSYHHIILDGWGMAALSEELFKIYDGLLNSRSIELGPVYQYSHYITWLYGQNKEAAASYWSNYLEGYERKNMLGRAQLHADQSDAMTDQFLRLSPDITNQLKQLAIENRSTLHTVVAAVWGVLLQKLNNTQDVVFGSVVSGRPTGLEGIEQTIGLIINTLPIRVQCEGEMRFNQLVKRIQTESLESEKYSYYPLYEIQRDSVQLDHILVFENYPIQEGLKNSGAGLQCGLTIANVEVYEQTNYDFNIIVEAEEGLVFKIRYNSAVFEHAHVEKILEYLSNIIKSVVNESHIPIRQIDISNPQERNLYLDSLMGDLESEYV
ncbi:amino acid adenylation domain-containing protein [Paenibacillus sp. FSL W8-0439]|uniref:amino acid adenylation domain-containing protein n=1 Tax=Paenibacillus sp. FSL W8-0439 TaxID=2921716 RepID=UPI0030FCB406